MVVPFTSVKGAWTPKLLRPALWIDPRRTDRLFQTVAGTTAVTDGSVCGYVGDVSGNGFDLVSSGDSSVRPNWKFNNGLPYLDFDSAGTSNTSCRNTSTSLGLYAAGSCSVFIAVRANPAVGESLWVESGSTNTPHFGMTAHNVTATTTSFFCRDDASTTLFNNNNAVLTSTFDNTDRVVGFIWNGTNFREYNNMTESAAFSLASGSTITTSNFALGHKYSTAGGDTAPFECRIYGFIVIKRAINLIERVKLTKYLGARMGLVL